MQNVFIHGLGQTPSSWDKTISCLSEQINAQCPDLSSLLKGAESTYENLYQAFAAYCDEFPEPIDLCGISLGAVLALNYAIDNPQNIVGSNPSPRGFSSTVLNLKISAFGQKKARYFGLFRLFIYFMTAICQAVSK